MEVFIEVTEVSRLRSIFFIAPIIIFNVAPVAIAVNNVALAVSVLSVNVIVLSLEDNADKSIK